MTVRMDKFKVGDRVDYTHEYMRTIGGVSQYDHIVLEVIDLPECINYGEDEYGVFAEHPWEDCGHTQQIKVDDQRNSISGYWLEKAN